MNCYACKSKKLYKFLSLGHQAPSDAFLTREELEKEEITYPLDVFLCEECFLVQLGYAVPPEILFNETYAYNTGTNNSLRANFKLLVDSLVERFKLSSKDLAIDIGSNDGALLKNYTSHGVKILGIDPSGATKLAIQDGVPTMETFFDEKSAKAAKKKYGQASIITSTNTFAHIHNLDSTMQGIKLLLSPKGVFVSDSHYLLDMIEKMQYDWVYHEHLRHYALKPLQTLFARFDMEIFDVEHIQAGHGGSIRVYTAHKGSHPISKNVANLIAQEEKAGLYKKSTYERFAQQVAQTKLELLKLVTDLKTSGKRIVGIGAPAKGNTLLNYCKLDTDLIDYLAERNTSFKIGKFSPGLHIPVIDEKEMYTNQPDYGLLLSWNLAEELMLKLRKSGFKGKFIIPNPRPRIVD